LNQHIVLPTERLQVLQYCSIAALQPAAAAGFDHCRRCWKKFLRWQSAEGMGSGQH
jgi:hypothetical protein